MPRPAPALAALPEDVLAHIAYRLALADLLGPPRHLTALLCTCRRVHHVLRIDNNAYLYARIFRAKFDHRAAGRRFALGATYSSSLAAQLVIYCRTLANIARGDIDSPTLLDDFWAAFTLCSENDGRNIDQLEHAGLFPFAERFILHRLWEDRDQCNGWPMEDITNALALWLYWYSATHGASPSRPRPHSHPPAPQNASPPSPSPSATPSSPSSAPTPSTTSATPLPRTRQPLPHPPPRPPRRLPRTLHRYAPRLLPPYRDPALAAHTLPHRHYGQKAVTLAEPPIGLVAKLLYVALQEQEAVDVDQLIPLTRADAVEVGWVGQTREDVREFARTRAVRFVSREGWDWRARLGEEGDEDRAWRWDGKSPSVRQENDWERWRGCFDPWDWRVGRGVTYTFGSLAGKWGGRFLDPGDAGEYVHAMHARAFDDVLQHPTRAPFEHALFFTLREHHCVSPARALPCPVSGGDPLDEGAMNAFLPSGFEGMCAVVGGGGGRPGVLRVRWGGEEYRYETYVEGRENSHDEATCEMCAAAQDGAQEEEDGDEDEEEEEEMRVERARRTVQHALGEGRDVEEFIAAVADQDQDQDRDGEDVRSVASSASTSGSGATEMFRTCSGITDIILTGETSARHDLAYGNFTYYGRVRAWDGLVVLVRAPAAPRVPALGRDPDTLDVYVFRGYLVGGENFVGAWRHVTDSVHTIPIEGPFVVSRVVEDEGGGGGGEAGRAGEVRA
ncbi:hypothetical protein C8Q78DRAFT_1078082 [Trametes maxima]|nr:hypothetical protein C8Q78DRAFT_1078082 [Trametes maxima]